MIDWHKAPLVEPLNKSELYSICSSAIEVLETVGVRIQDQEMLQLLRDAGADVDPDEKVAKMPEYLVKEALMREPRQVNMAGRDGTHTLKLGSGRTYFANQDASFMEDRKTRQWRASTKNDVEKFAKLNDALENVGLIVRPAARDISPEIMDLHEFEAVVHNTTKPFHLGPYRGADSITDFVKMASIARGHDKRLSDRPLFSVAACCTSPLSWDVWSLSILKECAKHRSPVYVAGQPTLGGTGPVTLAGSLVVGTAEVLSGVVMGQLVNRGTPVMYWDGAYPVDQRTGVSATGSPEHALINFATPQVCKFLGIPSCVIALTDAFTFDAQAGYEKSFSFMSAILGRADIVWGVGGMGPCLSYTQAVIDDEIVEMNLRIARGIEVNDDTLALDVIKRVGPGKAFIGDRHTKDHHRRELVLPSVSNRLPRQLWESRGRPEIGSSALKRANELIETHHVDPISKDIASELKDFISRREKELVK
jgi:trimethylamine--corrinoid protein Co-methyltransferase